jgi:hypothetical protein
MEETAGHFDRSVRINEAVGIAELFEVSLDALGSSTLKVVAHRDGCGFLIERTRQRWPLRPAGLPDTPSQTPFGRYAGHPATLAAWEKRRASRSTSEYVVQRRGPPLHPP